MKRILTIITITVAFTSCGTGNDTVSDSDTTSKVNSTTPPVSDTSTLPANSDTSTMGRMMGDTTKVKIDSTK
ncbi:MAG: hypothetical protein V4717_00530 [Bacteroidota bacterium]